jgi:hypothetical protein
VLDAHETLERFMVGDTPDPEAFGAFAGTVLGEMTERYPEGTLVRAYGEMVDLLCREGRHEAAVRLEALWNKVAAAHGLALLCGYSMEHFHEEIDLLERICEQHTHVMPPDLPTGSYVH